MYQIKNNALSEVSGGAGGINYIENPDAEINVDGWTRYLDAVSEIPEDGSGAGIVDITFTRNTTNPLRGTADFNLNKIAQNAQGQGVSYDFTIDVADQAKKLTISFDYDASDANYADDDIKVFIYDVTNTTLIRVNGEDLKGGKGTHYAQFQTAADSTSYRLILHVSSTNAAAYDVFFDNVKVGPGGAINASSDSMVRLYGSGLGHGSTNNKIRRFSTIAENIGGAITYTQSSTDGDSFTINEKGIYHISYTDGYNGGPATIGLSLNSTQLTTNINAISDPDRLALTVSAATNFEVSTSWSGILDKGDIIRAHTDGNPNNNTGTQPILFTISKIGEAFGSDASVSGGREIVVEGAGNDGATYTANSTNILFTETRDTTASWDGTTFTAPETGEYLFSGSIYRSGTTSNWQVDAYVNNVKVKAAGYINATTSIVNFSSSLNLNKGDTLTFRTNITSVLVNSTDYHHIHIQKLASPQTILETETVAARYTSNSGQSLGSTTTTYIYEDLISDTHNAYDTSTGVYTVPVSGYYNIHGSAGTQSKTLGTSNVFLISVFVDGVLQQDAFLRGNGAATTWQQDVNCMIYLEKGQEVTIRGFISGSALMTTGNPERNIFSIARIK